MKRKVGLRALLLTSIVTFVATIVILNLGGDDKLEQPVPSADLDEWRNRPWREKLLERAANLIGSQL